MREMKDSGIDIIGNIPNTYKIKRLKYLCSITTGDSDTQDNDPDGIFPFYVRSPIVEKANHYTFAGTGILIAGDGVGAGKVVHYATGKYAVHQRVYRLFDFSKEINPMFLYYYIKNRFSEEIAKGSAKSTVDSIRLPMLLNFRIIVPPVEEQNLIVKKITNKCSKIDSLVTDINNQIDILEKYKKNIIYKIVTKGLDNSVKLQDTGFKWIGQIPISWKTKKLKYLVLGMDSLFMDGDWINSDVLEDVGIPYYTTGNIGDGVFKISENTDFISEETFQKLFCTKIFCGDLLFSRLNAPYGRACIMPNENKESIVAVDVAVLRPDKNINKKYLMYFTMTVPYQAYTDTLARGTTMRRLSRTQLGNIVFPIPPLEEQNNIVNFLNNKCYEINLLIKDKQKQLETLEAYKKSLIYEYVTGKKEIVNE